ncbi:MAG TPA: YihY/virulence factor BrkB family protein [Steroidobacteraceae bacterium]|nr:YihY/virulence factor BrkB family protein [Steroidobacteraceae bacterium]
MATSAAGPRLTGSWPRRGWRLLACSVRYWIADNSSSTGAALAFYCAFSLAPLLIIVLTVAGTIIGQSAAYDQIALQLTAMFGPATTRILMGALKSSQHANGVLPTVVSVVTLLIGATTVLAALEDALERIWNTRSVRRTGLRGWIRTRLLSLGIILALGFLLLVSLTVSTALSSVRELIGQRYADVLALFGAIDHVLSLVSVAIIFTVIYRWMPAERLRWSIVVPGGLLTAVLFEIGRWAIAVYLSRTTEPSAFGAAASFAALLLWLYYTAQIFLFGAEFTACLGGLHIRRAPAPAIPVQRPDD